MASISSAGSFTLPVEQPIRSRAENSIIAAEGELTPKQRQTEKQTPDQQTPDQQTADQQRPDQQRPSLQKFEVAQQEAQRAEFNQQAGIVRETEPYGVRSPSSTLEQLDKSAQEPQQQSASVILMRDNVSSENTAINTFNQLQNIDAPPRQGQALNTLV